MSSWDKFFVEMADFVSQKSKDPSTKIGAVIVGQDNEVVAIGFNGFPRSVEDTNVPTRYERPTKYEYTEHAERNAIFNAARIGASVHGCSLYMNAHPVPCTDCTRAVIQSGISTIIGPTESKMGPHWEDNLRTAKTMLEEAGIEYYTINTEEND